MKLMLFLHTALLAVAGTGTLVLALGCIEFIADCYRKLLSVPYTFLKQIIVTAIHAIAYPVCFEDVISPKFHTKSIIKETLSD